MQINLMKSFDYYIEASHSIAAKWYIGVGAILGGTKGFMETHGTDIALTFLFGFIGASGAGAAKLLWDWIGKKAKKLKKNKDEKV